MPGMEYGRVLIEELEPYEAVFIPKDRGIVVTDGAVFTAYGESEGAQ